MSFFIMWTHHFILFLKFGVLWYSTLPMLKCFFKYPKFLYWCAQSFLFFKQVWGLEASDGWKCSGTSLLDPEHLLRVRDLHSPIRGCVSGAPGNHPAISKTSLTHLSSLETWMGRGGGGTEKQMVKIKHWSCWAPIWVFLATLVPKQSLLRDSPPPAHPPLALHPSSICEVPDSS